jgi:hypothetical protein
VVGKLYILTAAGLTLPEAVTAGQPLDAVVAAFHDDEPGMLGRHYQVNIDWGDKDASTGQAWTTGGGHWVATGSHSYAEPGTCPCVGSSEGSISRMTYAGGVRRVRMNNSGR